MADVGSVTINVEVTGVSEALAAIEKLRVALEDISISVRAPKE